MDLSLGFIVYAIYVQTEKLEFPAASASAATIVAMAERGRDYHVLLASLLSGVVYNIISFWPAFLTGTAALQLIPRGLIDLTTLIEHHFPGVTFGVTTDLFPIFVGFLLPPIVSLSMFVGSFGCYFIGNYLVTQARMWPEEFPWSPGLGMGQITLHSQLYFWFSLGIGLSIAALILPLAMRPSILTNAFRGLVQLGRAGGRSVSMVYILFGAFIAAALISTFMVYVLVPGFPFWITLFFSLGWSLFASFISAYSIGVTFSGFGVPYLKEMTIYYSGYRGYDIFLAPMAISGGGAWLAATLKQAYMTKTSINETIRVYIYVTVIGFITSFIFVQLLWSVSPIPGGAYPYTITGWPSENIAWARWFRWIWTGHLFRAEFIILGVIIGITVYLATTYGLNMPHILVSFIAGIFMPPPFIGGSVAAGLVSGGAMTLGQIGALTGQVGAPTFSFAYGPIPTTISAVIGSIFGKYVLEKRFGRENWAKMAPLVVTGFGLGDSIMWVLAWSILMISKALWIMPY
jgi:hypothetical protein